jgi:hypothetical protein
MKVKTVTYTQEYQKGDSKSNETYSVTAELEPGETYEEVLFALKHQTDKAHLFIKTMTHFQLIYLTEAVNSDNDTHIKQVVQQLRNASSHRDKAIEEAKNVMSLFEMHYPNF